MNYSENASICRVDFFKPSGKWMYTEAIDFTEYYGVFNYANYFKEFLKSKIGNRHSELTAVCITPYNKHSFPIMCTL